MSTGQSPATPADTDIRETVRERYAAAARATDGSCCVPSTTATTDEVFGAALYGDESDDVAKTALSASLGCGVPTAVADLYPGEVVLDLGSGAGGECCSARAGSGRPAA